MSNSKKLQNKVTSEKKRVTMVPGRISLRPRATRTVQINDGSYDRVPIEPIHIETEGEMRMGYHTRLFDMSNSKDREAIEKLEEFLEENPRYRTDHDKMISIEGEYSVTQPWPGYDDQNVTQVENFWNAMPEAHRPKIELAMKYELARVDENGDPALIEDRIKLLNKIYDQQLKTEKENADKGVEL